MRNLKKVLSLVLCAAMMLSVMVMSTGAAFADQDKITHTEAVDMAVALKIIDGKEDNKFDPTGNVTRAEMAKMICVALNGGKAPVLGSADKTSFTDTKGHWAAAYIESCVSQGIVSGVGGGLFQPEAAVTPTQAAKMLLVALGYKSENEGFTGDSWAVKVNTAAASKHLYDELVDVKADKAMNRDDAAQMIWNALNAYEVEYTSTLVSVNGQLTTQIKVQDKDPKVTLLEDKYEAKIATGILTEVEWNKTKKEYVNTIQPVATSAVPNPASITFNSTEDFSDLFGMNTKVVYKVDKKTNDVMVYGIVAKDSKVMTTGILNDLPTIGANDTSFKIDGVEYKLTEKASDIEAYAFLDYTGTAKLNAVATKDNAYYAFDLIDNTGDDKADIIVTYPVQVAKATYVSSTGVRVGSTTYDFSDNNIADGIKKDEWVLIAQDANTSTQGADIAKAEVVTGKVDGKDGDKVRVNGNWYKMAAVANLTAPALKADVKLVTFNGYYFDKEGASSNLDVATVLGVGTYNSMDKVTPIKLMLDGKETIVNADGNVTSSINADTVVSYVVDNDKYTLTTLTNNMTTPLPSGYVATTVQDVSAGSAVYKYTKKASTITVGSATYDIAKDATVVLYNKADDKYVAMTGEDLMAKNDITFDVSGAQDGAVIVKDGKTVSYMFAISKNTVTTGSEKYGMITKAYLASNGDNKQKLYIDIIIDGEKKTGVETDKTSLGSDFAKYSIVSYVMQGDVMALSAKTPSGTGAVEDYNSSRVLFRGNTRVAMKSDTVIIGIDSKNVDNIVYAGNSLAEANAKTFNGANGAADTWYNNATYISDNDGAVVIFVDVADKGDLASTVNYTVASAANTDVEALLAKYGQVTLTGTTGITSDINVPANTTLNLTGAATHTKLKSNAGTVNVGAATTITEVTANDGTINVNADTTITTLTANDGTINVNADTTITTLTANAGKIAVAAGKTLTVTNGAVNNISGVATAKLVLSNNSTDDAAANTWYTAAGSLSAPGVSVAGTAITSGKVLANTYVYQTVYTNTTGANTLAWSK